MSLSGLGIFAISFSSFCLLMFAHLIYFLIYQFLKVVPLRLGCLYYVQFQQRQIILIPLVKSTDKLASPFIDIVFTTD